MASVGIVALAFCLLSNISGAGMWAVAAMSAAPAAMGIAMAFYITKHPQGTSANQELGRDRFAD